jgi:hypothetical protein
MHTVILLLLAMLCYNTASLCQEKQESFCSTLEEIDKVLIEKNGNLPENLKPWELQLNLATHYFNTEILSIPNLNWIIGFFNKTEGKMTSIRLKYSYDENFVQKISDVFGAANTSKESFTVVNGQRTKVTEYLWKLECCILGARLLPATANTPSHVHIDIMKTTKNNRKELEKAMGLK